MATSTAVRRRRRDDARETPKADRYRSSKPVDDDDDLDEDEEESPRARRRREREEEPSTKRRGRAFSRDEEEDDDLDEDDVDDDDKEDEDEDDEPRGRRGRRSSGGRRSSARDEDDDEDDDDDEDEDDDDDEDEDDEPRGRRGRTSRNGSSRKSSAGWDSFNKKRKQMGNFANELKVPDDGDQVLIKFLDDEPFASYGQHWITTAKGLRSYVCLEPEPCPLCDRLADIPRAMAAFNVLVLDEDATPKLTVWATGPQITQILETKANAKTGPLSREYYAVSRTKSGSSKKGPVQYSIDVVKTRDLEEDWGVRPLKDSVLDKYADQAYDEEKFVKRGQRKELAAVARDAMDDED